MTYFTNDEVAVVTGSASGIGRSCATTLAREGARVIVSDIDEEGGKETVQIIKDNGGEATFKITDVSQPEEFEALIKFATDIYGGLHALVNNAGIGGEQAETADYSLESWNTVLGVNLNGVFYGTKYAIPAMLQSGGGAIINISSILGEVGFPNAVAYVSAKHAILGLTKTAAMEYSARGIRINAVGPAFINTPLLAGLDAAMMEMLVQQHPIGRLGESSEVAELVVWLASDKASFCTGAYYPVDGGYLIR